ncbi:DUF2059 domain-containing protein [Halioxenophilus sp. WMMB6]|uniref:DUF2059 domain-containing protein n=1 Tax=Halioxenophilus sp. WMMB6 TaxID=3073815 RepID=UPI00295F35DA|nr:DUF2059 domain-containing protein [Halioxenophilus sp. WMMB6]
MNAPRVQFLLAALIGLVCSFQVAATPEADIERVLLLSGLTKQVNEFPGLIEAGVMQGAQQGADIPERELSLITESVSKTILPAVIMADVRQAVASAVSESELQSLLTWYQSETGRAITTAEENASTAEAYQQIMANGRQLLSDRKRVDFAMRLDKLLGATDLTMQMQEVSGVAVYAAMMSAMAPGQALNLDGYRAQIAAAQAQMRPNIEQMMAASFVYTYQPIDDTSLAKYEAFLNTPAAKKFNAAAMAGLLKGIEKAVGSWATELGTIVKNSNAKEI